jgi:hypothetical protein
MKQLYTAVVEYLEKSDVIKHCINTLNNDAQPTSDDNYQVSFTEEQQNQFSIVFNDSNIQSKLHAGVIELLRPNLHLGEGIVSNFFSMADRETRDIVISELKTSKFNIAKVDNDLRVKWHVQKETVCSK